MEREEILIWAAMHVDFCIKTYNTERNLEALICQALNRIYAEVNNYNCHSIRWNILVLSSENELRALKYERNFQKKSMLE